MVAHTLGRMTGMPVAVVVRVVREAMATACESAVLVELVYKVLSPVLIYGMPVVVAARVVTVLVGQAVVQEAPVLEEMDSPISPEVT